jgi:hypothetical protein
VAGISEIAMFQFYYSKNLDVEKFADVGTEMISYCIEKINDGYSMPTYYNGIEQDCYFHGFTIEILDSERKKTLARFDTIAYTATASNLTPILGTYRFLEFLHISIDYSNQ